MSNYTKTTDFEAKDSLPSGNTGKIIRGSEFETEFDNISTAIATKADLASPAFSGTINITSASINDGSVTISGFLDEDTMATNSASHVPTQQSVKAYVDAQTAGTVTETGTQTLTNKTLTTPVIATISNTGTLTLPTSTDTLVGRATTDTLTNKTLTSAVLNTSVSGTAVLDDDTFATASATTLASSESIKAYVDSNTGSGSLTGIDDNATAVAITIDSSERVGINNITPAKELDVVGQVKVATDDINHIYFYSETGGSLGGSIGTPAPNCVAINSGLVGGEFVRFDTNNERIGIGLPSPSYEIHMSLGGYNRVYLDGTSGDASLETNHTQNSRMRVTHLSSALAEVKASNGATSISLNNMAGVEARFDSLTGGDLKINLDDGTTDKEFMHFDFSLDDITVGLSSGTVKMTKALLGQYLGTGTYDTSPINVTTASSSGTTYNVVKFGGSGSEVEVGEIKWKSFGATAGSTLLCQGGNTVIELRGQSGGTFIGSILNGTITAPDLPTSDPASAGQLWNDSGTLKVSAG